MSKRIPTPKEKLFRWCITRIRSTNEAIYGAIKEFGITNPEHQARLVARRVG